MCLFLAAMILTATPAERKVAEHSFDGGNYVLSIEFRRDGKLEETTLNVLVTVEKKGRVRISVEKGQDLVVGVLANNTFQSVAGDKATIVLSGELRDHNNIVGTSISTIGKDRPEGKFTLKKIK